MRTARILPLLAVLTLACRGDDGDGSDRGGARAEPGGTIIISGPADADFLLPPLVVGGPGKTLSSLIYERLAEIGPELNTVGDDGFEPRLAERWEWAPDSLSIRFHLNPRARWHDGRPVRASDVRFSHALYSDTIIGSPALALIANIDSVSVADSLTAVVWFARRSAEQFYDVAYQLFILPEHVLGTVPRDRLRGDSAAQRAIGSGRFRLARREAGTATELVADTTHYRGRPALDRVVWSIAPDPNTALARLTAHEADMLEFVAAASQARIAGDSTLRLMPYPLIAYGYAAFNLRSRDGTDAHPVFGDREVRRALSMALDRRAMIRNVYDTLATLPHGPFSRRLFTADTTIPQLPFDPPRARAILDSLGWRDRNDDGIRERGGRPLTFSILVPSSSRPRISFALLMQSQLKDVGAQVEVEQLEFNAFLERMRSRRFDMYIGLFNSDPSPSAIRQSWSSAGARPDGSNAGSWRNASFDAALDSATMQPTAAAMKSYYSRAYRIAVEDAPAVWLYEPIFVAALDRRIEVTGVRPDAWWAGLAEWTIPPDRRIARDRIGLRPTTP